TEMIETQKTVYKFASTQQLPENFSKPQLGIFESSIIRATKVNEVMMKRLFALILLMSLSGGAFAQELNPHLEDMLMETKASLADYSRNSPSEIYDGSYDENDLLL